MPRTPHFQQEDILNAAFSLVRRDGLEALNARAVARELHCSTQPIFRFYSSMDVLRQAVEEKAMSFYAERIRHSSGLDTRPYRATGLAYIAFARNEPQLFRMLFMCDHRSDAHQATEQDSSMDYVLDTIQQSTGYSREKALYFNHIIWIFTHGLAVMVATQFVPFSDDEIRQLLSEHYLATRARFDTEDVPASV